MLILTTNVIQNKQYEELGMVTGSMVQSKNFLHDFASGLKTIIGGELGSYTKMMDEARNMAVKRMVKEATNLGADAVIGVNFSSSAVMQGAAEILAYGTAVKFL